MPVKEKNEFDPANQGSLLERTRALLNADPRNLNEIQTATGLPLYWLRTMRQGTTDDPSVNKVQFLYEHLSGYKLNVR